MVIYFSANYLNKREYTLTQTIRWTFFGLDGLRRLKGTYMLWSDKLIEDLKKPQIINDSKTPSGRVHVGSLRGVLIHDAIFRSLRDHGVPARYLFGVDDYDPVDEIPFGQGEHYEEYLGMPLCNVPPPPGSNATDMADHFIQEFFDVFDELGVETENYRMRDIYRSGKFNEAIDIILRHKDTVQTVYKEVSKAERPDTWYPFQVICEGCGRIGTTEVIAYDGKEVTYRCRPDLVTWARGCGYDGKISPFDGNGKLPWKLEWVAKWFTFNITIEGAGKDHSTKGGSRDVSSKCLREIFHQKPPLNIPYEFFLVGGAKMSSSRGLGATARAMADLLPPEILRFLMLRTYPKRPVNFSTEEKYIIKVFNDYDRLHSRVSANTSTTEEDKKLYQLCDPNAKKYDYVANFQLVTTLVQMPHLDVEDQIKKQKGSALTVEEIEHLRRRIKAAQHWVDNYALEEEKTRLHQQLPDGAHELNVIQRAFLYRLSDALDGISWEDEIIQSKIFHTTRTTPIRQPMAFQAIYRVLLDRESGPKAGNLLVVLQPEFVVKRFKELSYSKAAFWVETGINPVDFEAWFTKEKARILSGYTRFDIITRKDLSNDDLLGYCDFERLGAIELYLTLDDNKEYVKRVLFKDGDETDDYQWNESQEFTNFARNYVNALLAKHHLSNIST